MMLLFSIQEGMRQQLVLGRWLRQRYVIETNLMNGTYVNDEVGTAHLLQ